MKPSAPASFKRMLGATRPGLRIAPLRETAVRAPLRESALEGNTTKERFLAAWTRPVIEADCDKHEPRSEDQSHSLPVNRHETGCGSDSVEAQGRAESDESGDHAVTAAGGGSSHTGGRKGKPWPPKDGG